MYIVLTLLSILVIIVLGLILGLIYIAYEFETLKKLLKRIEEMLVRLEKGDDRKGVERREKSLS